VARTVPVSAVGAPLREEMYALFERYYADTERARFEKDLSDKDEVILLEDARTRTLQGFSTLKLVTLSQADGTRCRAMYSGDTVIARGYWGQSALGLEFLRRLWLGKARRPLEPLYWFLISKGYKTYLLMANNFPVHYPRHEAPTPPGMQRLLDALATQAFGQHYSAADGLIRFPRALGRVREEVAPISEEECASNPRIRFFAERNPRWAEGTELACLAEMTFLLPLEYGWKGLLKRLRRG
jgi:hypothetical protein